MKMKEGESGELRGKGSDKKEVNEVVMSGKIMIKGNSVVKVK
jgi:hypothetical protein